MIDSAEPVPSTSSELVDNRLSTQEGKQTSQELASTSERLRSVQALVKNFDSHLGSQAQGYWKQCCYPSGLELDRILKQVWGKISSRWVQACPLILKIAVSVCSAIFDFSCTHFFFKAQYLLHASLKKCLRPLINGNLYFSRLLVGFLQYISGSAYAYG